MCKKKIRNDEPTRGLCDEFKLLICWIKFFEIKVSALKANIIGNYLQYEEREKKNYDSLHWIQLIISRTLN